MLLDFVDAARAKEFVEVVRKVMEAAGVIMSTLSVKFLHTESPQRMRPHFRRYGYEVDGSVAGATSFERRQTGRRDGCTERCADCLQSF